MRAFERIPDELRALRHWVCWRLEMRPDKNGTLKQTKVPCQITGALASTTDSKTWTSFDACVAQNGKFNGIGFVFSKSAGFVGIDLDKCRNPKTGLTEPWALEIIKQLDSYTELSQSGCGWHVIVKSSLPQGRNRAGRVEMYDNGRFFVITGCTQFDIGTDAINPRDLSELQRRLPTLDPAVKVTAKTALVNDSEEDFRLIGEVQRKVQAPDADALEQAFQKVHPERYAARNREKGARAGKSYIRYTIDNFLARNPAQAEIEEESELITQDDPWPEFLTLTGPLHDLAEVIAPDLAYEHKILHLITSIGLGLSGRVKLATDPWLQPRFYACMISPPGQTKTAVDKEVRRVLWPREDEEAQQEARYYDESDVGIFYNVSPVGSRCSIMGDVRVEFSINSEPALVQLFDAMRPGCRRLLYAPDELTSAFEKARQTSNSPNSLVGAFLRLYESNEIGRNVVEKRNKEGQSLDPGARIKLGDAHFAMITSATPIMFERVWQGTGGAAGGLQSRFVLSYSDRPLPPFQKLTDKDVAERLVSDLAARLEQCSKTLTMSEAAKDVIIDWTSLRDEPLQPRIVDMAKRFALVIAACNGLTEIDEPTILLGRRFADYQSELRKRLMPADADGQVQAFENRIIAFYKRHKRATLREARQVVKPERYPGGFAAFERAMGSLVRTGKLWKTGQTRKGKATFELD